MRTRVLGQSGIEASVVGFGAWAIGGWMWGGSDEKESIKAIDAAIDSGATFIDTAPAYGFGVSEKIVGKAIQGKRDKVVLATKCGIVCGSTGGQLFFRSTAFEIDSDGHIPVFRNLSPQSIREEVESSLKRLRTDYIDLYQTHWQEPTTPIADTMGELLRLKKEGKIRAIGVSNAGSRQMEEYRKVGEIDSDQEKYSMIDRRLEQDQLPYCKENNIAVLAYSPMELGLLSGKMGPDRKFNEGDQRLSDPKFNVENRIRIATLLESIKSVADARKLTIAQLVIAWTLHQPGLTHALCGARGIQQAKENAQAGDVRLTSEELAQIDVAVGNFK